MADDTIDGLGETDGAEETLYLTMIVFPIGEFQMGTDLTDDRRVANEVPYQAQIATAFAVSDREVTWHQWVSKEGNQRKGTYEPFFGHAIEPNHPAFGIDWWDTVYYCVWLTEQTERESCYEIPAEQTDTDWPVATGKSGFRQPSEREWECLARSGTSTAYSFGNDSTWLTQYCWYANNSDEWLHEVAMLRPNPRGLVDVHGNVLEWTYDWYDEDLSVAEPGAQEEFLRVPRGGSWMLNPGRCRASMRHRYPPEARQTTLGFRIVQSLPAED